MENIGNGEAENWRKWEHGSTFTTASNESGNDLETYEKELGFNRKELEGLTVLDLGSGATEKLSRGLKQAGITANVISLNPDYARKDLRQLVQEKSDWQKKSVAAVAQELPFKDESFDKILGMNSVTLYANPRQGTEATKRWLSEIVRVLKPDGEAKLGPIMFILKKGSDEEPKEPEEYSKFVEELRRQGIFVEFHGVFYRKEDVTSNTYMIIRKPKNI